MSYNRQEQLRTLHEERKKSTLEKVETAMHALQERNEEVTFSSVARESGVQRSTLYRNQAVNELITRAKDYCNNKTNN